MSVSRKNARLALVLALSLFMGLGLLVVSSMGELGPSREFDPVGVATKAQDHSPTEPQEALEAFAPVLLTPPTSHDAPAPPSRNDEEESLRREIIASYYGYFLNRETELERIPQDLWPLMQEAGAGVKNKDWTRAADAQTSIAFALRSRGQPELAEILFMRTVSHLATEQWEGRIPPHESPSVPGELLHIDHDGAGHFRSLRRHGSHLTVLQYEDGGRNRPDASIPPVAISADDFPWHWYLEVEDPPLLMLPVAKGMEPQPWLADDQALYEPNGTRHPLVLRDYAFLASLGFDEARGHTLELTALRLAPGARFIVVRGEIRAPTPTVLYGTRANPPRLDDLAFWDPPRTGIQPREIRNIRRAGFEGVLDRRDGTLAPIRVWSFAEHTARTARLPRDAGGYAAAPKELPVPLESQPKVPWLRRVPTNTVSVAYTDQPMPDEHVILAISADARHVAFADIPTRRLELLRHDEHGYERVLSVEYSLPDARPIRAGRIPVVGTGDYLSSHPGAALLNPCAAFAGRDGRTLLVHQGHELSVWRLDDSPRLLARRSALPLGWFMVSPDGECAVGIALRRSRWDDIPLSERGVDMFVDGLDGEQPRIKVLGTVLRAGVVEPSPLQAAFTADERYLRIFFGDSWDPGYVLLHEIPRP